MKTPGNTLGDRLRAIQQKRIKHVTELIEEHLLAIAETRSNDEIHLSVLGLTPDEMRDDSVIERALANWAKGEKVNMDVKWTHPDCGLGASCGPGCKPMSLCFSWDS